MITMMMMMMIIIAFIILMLLITLITTGKTYMRFKSNDGRHRHICSVLKAIEKDAVDRGLNAESVVAAYKKLQDDEKKAEKAERERSGKMLGEHPKIASHVFSRCFGSIPCVLDSAQRVVSCFPRNAQVFAILGDNTQSAERCESS